MNIINILCSALILVGLFAFGLAFYNINPDNFTPFYYGIAGLFLITAGVSNWEDSQTLNKEKLK